MRVNGLYGHVRSNDARSLALFAGFVAAFHLLAMLGLLVPLAMVDPDHAPLYAWTGYLVRWVPIVTVIGAVLFVVQMAWHVRTVRRRTDFRFVDDHDEPRLCRIVEPLAIAAGLPTPYVGVIDSPALNAFACGIRQKDAVLVFTRGLIDGLDDDELAAVAAHEIVHVVNGDIRLIAATNVCLDTLKLLQLQPNRAPANRIKEACSLPLLTLLLPMMVVLILVVMFLRRLAVDGSHLARLLIASAREFIADAEAARLTQNPAALVSALGRIEGRSVIPGLGAGQDAMMIDGAHEGAFATHPTIAERVAAIVSVTGSMALIAPVRRDTRPPELRAGEGFGRRTAPALEAAFLRDARQSVSAALARVSSDNEFNRLGLTREMSVSAIAAVGVFLWVHSADLRNPAALTKAFDPAPVRTFFAMAGEGRRCLWQGLGSVIGLAGKPTDCDLDKRFAAYRDNDGVIGAIADTMANQTKGVYAWPDGSFRNAAPPMIQLAEIREARCYRELLRRRPWPSLGDRAAEARRHDLASPLLGLQRRGRAERDGGFACRARRPSSRLLQSPQNDGFGHSSLLRRSRPAGGGGAVRLLRAPNRYRHAAPAAHRSQLRIDAESSGAGGTRSSRRSSAGLRLLHRPPGAKANKVLRSLTTPIRALAASNLRVKLSTVPSAHWSALAIKEPDRRPAGYRA
jgi:Zn-dependent protease with chaperone function